MLYATVCRPNGNGPFRVVIINHGTAFPSLQSPLSCSDEAPRWFLRQGYVVVQPIRRGFGATGGEWSEAKTFFTPQGCEGRDWQASALEAARDIAATVQYVTQLPMVDHNRIVVVGWSTGGFAAIAYDSLSHPAVTAIISFSPGNGGNNDGSHRICHADRLIDAVGQFGRTASTPMLWLHAHNDNLFSPELEGQMRDAFVGAGGKTELINVGIFDPVGHNLFRGWGGSTRWGLAVASYLARN